MRSAFARIRTTYEEFQAAQQAYGTRLSLDGLTEAVVSVLEEATHFMNMTKMSIDTVTNRMRHLGHHNITKLDQSILSVDNSCNKSLVVQNITKVDELPAHGIRKPFHNSTIKDSESFKDECTPGSYTVGRFSCFSTANHSSFNLPVARRKVQRAA